MLLNETLRRVFPLGTPLAAGVVACPGGLRRPSACLHRAMRRSPASLRAYTRLDDILSKSADEFASTAACP